MTHDNTKYALDPASFHSMRQAQELTDVLEGNLISLRLGDSRVPPSWWKPSPNGSTTPQSTG